MDPYDAFTARMRELVAGDRMAKAQVLTERYWGTSESPRWWRIPEQAYTKLVMAALGLIAAVFGVFPYKPGLAAS
jgi:hypothetical protein